ncbi:glycosyltransferase family 4 protein [Phaeacidiphilus oryzae]|uniref:glycosyltransferase family 4 protein n=1 Tax=Phaeacidiphilus oryzae TaxID=348818 RepID=UPI00068F0A7F|nr:glycosyltransferase family 4 protein [Phaeacidiphilus oryzae]
MSEEPQRHAEAGRLAVVTPWYPSLNRPFAGSFVRTMTAAVADRFGSVGLYHPEDWRRPDDPAEAELAGRAFARLAGPATGRVPVEPRTTAEGWELTRVPAVIRTKRNYADWGRTHEEALRAVLPGGVIDADVVHGHVGTYGGWCAVRLARPGARVVVTEHAAFLDRVLDQPAALAMYDEVLERAHVFLCVGDALRRQIAGYLPHHAEKLRVLPNAVDFDARAMREEPFDGRLRRLLYVGALNERKGTAKLLRAFAALLAEDPELTLTLVGPEDAPGEAARLAGELGVAGRVELLPPVPPQAVPGLLHRHDLLVHPSSWETFGMTVIEAVAAGTPVLATRCGGPEETLAGLEGTAGELIEVDEDPRVIADGYRRLRARSESGGLDLAEARSRLAARYGLPAVGAALAGVYGLDEPPAGEPAPRIGAPEPAAGSVVGAGARQ